MREYGDARPDAVLLDMNLPNVNGLNALSEILALDPRARVAMFTASGQQALIREATQSGAREFIVKPVDDELVLQAVERLLA